MKYLFTVFVFTLVAVNMASAAPKSDVKTIKVSDKLHVLAIPSGGNITVFNGEDGIILIDDQLTGREALVRDAVKEIAADEIRFILNTHYHFDHTGGNEVFGEKGAVLISHESVRERLSTKQFISQFKKEMLPLSKEGLPMVTFTQDLALHLNGEQVEITHLPASHTDGDAVAFFPKSNVIAAGDLIFQGMFPFIDIEHGGSILGLLSGLDTLIAMSDEQTRIIPGHGNVMGKAELKTYRDMLQTITDHVADALQKEMTLAQIIASKPTAAFDKTFSAELISAQSIVSTIYESLKNAQ